MRAAKRAAIHGWVENRAKRRGLSLIRDNWMDFGGLPGSTRPSVGSINADYCEIEVEIATLCDFALARSKEWRE